MSGACLAIDRELDLFGTLVLGCITAVGGGLTRDILLGVLPPTLFIQPVYIIVAASVSLAVFAVVFISRTARRKPAISRAAVDGVVNVFDAVGLGVFVIVGVNAAVSAGYGGNAFLSVFVGSLTGVGGGILRDMMAGVVPMVLRARIYALAAIAGACVYYIMYICALPQWLCMSCAAGLVIAVRVLAAAFRWSLPRVPVPRR